MSSIGRNDPCPCGSGKKYKKCCVDKYDDASDVLRGFRDAAESSQAAENSEYDPYPWYDQNSEFGETTLLDDHGQPIAGARDADEDEKEEEPVPQFPDPPEEPPADLPPELDRLVEDWWKAEKPLFMKRDADALVQHLTRFWDSHPSLVPHLELEMEFLFELGGELGRRKEWPRYAELLLRLRQDHPVAYLRSFGYYDRDLIIEAAAQGRVADIPRYFDYFHQYPWSDLDNADRVVQFLAWAGAESALLEFVKPIRRQPGDRGVSVDVDWLLFGLQIPHLEAGTEPEAAAQGVVAALRQLNMARAPRVDATWLGKAFDQARQAPSLPDYSRHRTKTEVADFHRDVTWNFTGYLHRVEGLAWTRASFLANRLLEYWLQRARRARPREAFSLDLATFEVSVCRSSRSMLWISGVRAASAIEALWRFAAYLRACSALDEAECQRVREACRALYQRALGSYESTDPVPRLMPALPEG